MGELRGGSIRLHPHACFGKMCPLSVDFSHLSARCDLLSFIICVACGRTGVTYMQTCHTQLPAWVAVSVLIIASDFCRKPDPELGAASVPASLKLCVSGAIFQLWMMQCPLTC